VKWMVLYHPPDCIEFFQRMLVIRWGHLDFPRVILHARVGRLQSTCLWLISRVVTRFETPQFRAGITRTRSGGLASEVASEVKVRWAIDGFGTCKAAGYELAKSFRPISLTSLKTMERLVDFYIRAGPLKSFPLTESQYAYQRSDLNGVVVSNADC
jgi:hypothetical protein